MNKLDQDYQNLLQDILDNGIKKQTRNGEVLSVFGRQIRHSMQSGFPVLTTKKIHWKSVASELLWFLQGRTDLRWLLEQGNTIWVGDAYKRYIMLPKGLSEVVSDNGTFNGRNFTKEEFINKIKTDAEFAEKWGSLGPVYGKQWRSWGNETEYHNGSEYAWYGPIDQIAELIDNLKTSPDSRRMLVSAWNPSDLPEQLLPPCHYAFQVYTRELDETERVVLMDKKLGITENLPQYYTEDEMIKHHIPKRAISLMFNMRSTDVPLGLPFNIASYALLLEIIAKMTNMVPYELTGNLGDCHIYTNQIEGVKEQLTRKPFELPTLQHMKTDEFYKSLSEDLTLLTHLESGDFVLNRYQSHSKISMPLSN